jgi:hypothetical protein
LSRDQQASDNHLYGQIHERSHNTFETRSSSETGDAREVPVRLVSCIDWPDDDDVGLQGYPLPDEPSPFRDFMKEMNDTGYIIFWVGLVKFLAGSLLFVRRTTPLALLIALPYTVNILLYCVFIANQYLLLGIPDLLCNAFLIYAWFLVQRLL